MNLISEAVLSKLTAVSKVRASTEVVRQVRAHIEDGTFQEGHRLPAERELADRLGVSRPVVREALRLLEVMGYIRTDAGRGTFVSRPLEPVQPRARREHLDLLEDQTLFEQLMAVRQAIEPPIARLAAERATAVAITRLRELHAEGEALALAGDIAAFTRADLAFHNALADAAGNRVFREIVDHLQDLLLAMRQISLADLSQPRARMTLHEHGRILEATARADGDEAYRAMLDHFGAQSQAYAVRTRAGVYPSLGGESPVRDK